MPKMSEKEEEFFAAITGIITDIGKDLDVIEGLGAQISAERYAEFARRAAAVDEAMPLLPHWIWEQIHPSWTTVCERFARRADRSKNKS